jgi:hypothetical protein
LGLGFAWRQGKREKKEEKREGTVCVQHACRRKLVPKDFRFPDVWEGVQTSDQTSDRQSRRLKRLKTEQVFIEGEFVLEKL